MIEYAQQAGEVAVMVVGAASILARAAEKITGITPFDAQDLHLPAIKRWIARANKALATLGLHPNRSG